MSDSLVSIRQQGECSTSNHDLFKFPPETKHEVVRVSGSQTEVAVAEMMCVKQVQPDTVQSKHEEHSQEECAKKAFFGYRTVGKKQTFHTHELDVDERRSQSPHLRHNHKIIVHFQSERR